MDCRNVLITVIFCIVCLCTELAGNPPENNVVYCEDGTIESAKITYRYYYTDCKKTECACVKNCPPPKTTFAELFAENGLDVNKIKIIWLEEVNYGISSKLEAKHFRGLDLKQVTMRYKEEAGVLPSPKADFLESVGGVTYLDFSFGKLPPLPENSRIEKVNLRKGTSDGPFGGCKELQSLSLAIWDVFEDSWLASCPKLATLSLRQISGSAVQRILHGVTRIKHLSINYCQFKDDHILTEYLLPDGFFDELGSLITLNLDDNSIGAMPQINISLPFLEELSLKQNKLGGMASGNRAGSSAVVSILRMAPRLRYLDVSDNMEFNICRDDSTSPSRRFRLNRLEHQSLKSLILDNTKSTIDCITKEGLPALEYLDLIGAKLTSFNFQDLLVSKVPLRVSFYSSPIKKVVFSEDNYNEIYERSNTTNKTKLKIIGLTSLDCDCNNAYFVKGIKEKLFTAELVTCDGGEDEYMKLRQKKKLSIHATQTTMINRIDFSKLECDKFPCNGCLCRRFWVDNSSTAECKNAGITQAPRISEIQMLQASHNHIEKLYADDFPESLSFADLSVNHIAHIDKATATAIFSEPNRRLRLSGNPILCDCENYFFLKMIQKHHTQIEDYKNMTCGNEGFIPLKDLDVMQLCPKITVLSATLLVSVSFLVMAAMISVLLYRYGRAVKIFLNARGWFTCCMPEDMSDEDRFYDAFISFCHEDEQLVMEEFTPRMEQLGFKTCVHYRDWTPGELIPTHIVRSVENSRRTIVMLSRSFLKSMWGLLEWRIAHARALKEGVVRVILVILDDAADEADLDPDLRSYLRSNTYVRWADPWFWDKIRYAMPRPRPRSPQNIHSNNSSETLATAIDNQNYDVEMKSISTD